MWLFNSLRVSICRESGATLLETAVAPAILGTIVVTFLTGLTTTPKATFTNGGRTTAEIVANVMIRNGGTTCINS